MNNLEDLIINILRQHGYDNLTEDDQKAMRVQFTAEAERRLGLAIMPLMSEETARRFADMVEKNQDPVMWYQFWKDNIPGFEDVVKKTLEDFAVEVGKAFQK